MINTPIKKIFLIFIMFFFITNNILFINAVELQVFESSIKSSVNTKTFPRYEKHNYNNSSWFDLLFMDLFADVFIWSFLMGGSASFDRIDKSYDEINAQPREIGEPLLPFIKLNSNYQWLKNDVYGIDTLFETGYGPLAFQFRKTDYHEYLGKENDQLNITQIQFMYRVSYDKYFEIDFGIGSFKIEGDDKNSDSCFSMPILIYPVNNFGIEFRPTWSKINGSSIHDYDFSFVMRTDFLSAKIGYRTINTDEESLNGPYLGISIYY